MRWLYRRVHLRRGEWVRAGLRVQPPHPDHPKVYQLRRAAEEHRALLPPWRVVLQLPPRSCIESLHSRLQLRHEVPELRFSVRGIASLRQLVGRFILFWCIYGVDALLVSIDSWFSPKFQSPLTQLSDSDTFSRNFMKNDTDFILSDDWYGLCFEDLDSWSSSVERQLITELMVNDELGTIWTFFSSSVFLINFKH